ncbi:MAG: thiamine pyrophosphate-dependent enzyme [Planctomycetota bacterium]
MKELSNKKENFVSGHRLCAGCGAAIVMRQALMSIDEPVVISNATGCLYVASATYPYTAWECNYIHSAFENASATISGIVAAYNVLKRRGDPLVKNKEIKFVAIGGDGGTYDIGLQSLSGALERGHNFLYICYNNEAYMNTGIQRSGATPLGASTTTTPSGSQSYGKKEYRKDLTAIVAAHNIPYVAQTTPAHREDLMAKVRKAISIKGPTFINVLSPCHRGWRVDMPMSLEMMRLSVDTCYWPLYEVENGNYKINYKPKEKVPVRNLLKAEGRFKHLFEPKEQTEVLNQFQITLDREWERLVSLSAKK